MPLAGALSSTSSTSNAVQVPAEDGGTQQITKEPAAGPASVAEAAHGVAALTLQPLDCINPQALLGLPVEQQLVANSAVTCAALSCSVYKAGIEQLEGSAGQESQLVQLLMLPRAVRKPHDVATIAGK